VLEPQVFTGERSNIKRVSLNNSNFLQIPTTQFKRNHDKGSDEKWGNESRKSNISNSSGGFSTMVHNFPSIEINDNIKG